MKPAMVGNLVKQPGRPACELMIRSHPKTDQTVRRHPFFKQMHIRARTTFDHFPGDKKAGWTGTYNGDAHDTFEITRLGQAWLQQNKLYRLYHHA